jgi:hypothetical protein
MHFFLTKSTKYKIHNYIRDEYLAWRKILRVCPSGETGGLTPAPAPVILVRNAG